MNVSRLGRLAAAIALSSLGGCAASTKTVRPLKGTPPSTVAVLPLEGGNLSPRARANIRRLVASALSTRQYEVLDDDFVDQQLALAGFQPWKPQWLPADDKLAAFGREVGVDAILVSESFEDTRFNAGIFFRRGLTGRLRLIDAQSGVGVWEAEAGASDSGGVLTGSGQVIRALSDTIDAGSEMAFLRFASSIALDVIDQIPESPHARDLGPMPQISSVSARAKGDLSSEDPVDLEARGTARCLARGSLGGMLVDYPLVEVTPGLYRGTIRVYAGAGTSDAPATVAFYDAWGRASEPRRSEEKVAFRAPRLDAPEGLAAEIVDRGLRRIRIRWEAIPGATDYLVFRSGAGVPRTLTAGGKTEITDELPADATGATYFVVARQNETTSSPRSRPLAVAL